VSVHNGHTDNCGADIPQFQLVALLVGRLCTAPLLAQQQILEYHSEDTPGDTRFRRVTRPKPLRVLPGVSRSTRLTFTLLRVPDGVLGLF